MIEASFGAASRAAAITGAYQYDTGQRLRLHGLPSPEAFSAADDFLSGGLAAVEVHFSRPGDSQSEMRLAIWDLERGIWLAAVPDEYLTRSEAVQVHVYVSHGADGENTRAQTMYEGTFTPVARAAPSSIVTPEQEAQWAQKKAEIDLALTAVLSAEQGALAVVASTNRAAQQAQEPAQDAGAAAQSAQGEADRLAGLGGAWEAATFSVTSTEPGTSATVSLRNENGVPHFAFGIPRGARGTDGAPGADGPTDVEFVMDGTTLVITTK